MFKRAIGLFFMIFCGVAVYLLFYRPELAMLKDALLALFK